MPMTAAESQQVLAKTYGKPMETELILEKLETFFARDIRELQSRARDAVCGTLWVQLDLSDPKCPIVVHAILLDMRPNAELHVASGEVVFGVDADACDVLEALARAKDPASSVELWKAALECLRGNVGDVIGLSANQWLGDWMRRPHRTLGGAPPSTLAGSPGAEQELLRLIRADLTTHAR